MCEIKLDLRGYYTLYIDGVFSGNYDSCSEAAHEYEDIMRGRLK